MAKKTRKRTKEVRNVAGAPSPITKLHTRDIKPAATVLLAARSGGRCEFAGCNKYLFEHPLTLRDGNFSERAHIVAFSEDGPRGNDGPRPADINSVDNLMLLCPACHKLIDDNPGDYPRPLLEGYKRDHEKRIKYVTGLGPDMRTTVVQLKAKIGGSAVDIPAPHIYEAVAPRYPSDRSGYVIDLTDYECEDRAEYYALATDKIATETERIYARGMDVEATRHISLFALGPIPILVYLGHRLSNKIVVDFYQRHRTGEPWKWKSEGAPVHYRARARRTGSDPSRVALILSLSGTIGLQHLPSSIDQSFTVYELTLEDRLPTPDFLRRREDLEEFRIAYREFLATLIRNHPAVKELQLFPAVPAPVAVACGHDLLPKVHPSLVTYDNDKASGGFIQRLRINDHDRQ
jgi:hypothetical protein